MGFERAFAKKIGNVMTLSLVDVLLASGFVGICLIISFQGRLQLHRTLLIASARTLVQLSFIGLILAWIFAQNRWWQVLTVLSIMTLIAAFAAVGRIKHAYQGLLQDTLIALTLGACLVTVAAIVLILRISPWYTPQFIIPILGMVLGNALTGVSLTIGSLTQALHDERQKINALLALSASPKEVTIPLVKSAITTGLTPTTNSMMVVGLVSLPGMMTGQILAGADPTQAVRYQIVTMFFICAGSLISCTVVSWLIVRRFFNQQLQWQAPLAQISWRKRFKKNKG